jgi:hypothetical protein
VKRLSSWALPIVLALAGVVLIIVGVSGGFPDVGGGPDLSPIARPSSVEPSTAVSASATAVPTEEPASATAEPSAATSTEPAPTLSPLPETVTAAQLEIPSVGINVLVRQSTSAETDGFPPTDAAYILRSSSQPGRNANSYVFAHALNSLFKPLWNVQIGAEILVRMSDESVLRYVVTEVRPNVACPDPNADPALNPPDPPLALQIHDDCTEGSRWTAPTDHERLTLQTSQGYNRNWGELVVVAEPAG